MRELIVMFLQGMLYVVVLLYIVFASCEVYKTYKTKLEPAEESQQEEQPVPTNQQPMYILSPRKES